MYKYCRHNAAENAYGRRRIIGWTGAGPLRRRFDEWRVAANVVAWKLRVVASSMSTFTIGMVTVVRFPWNDTETSYVLGFRGIDRRFSEETTCFPP